MKLLLALAIIPTTFVWGNICPDSSSCPGDNTCCPALFGGYGCCPKANAVCCSDGMSCCPEGYICLTPLPLCAKAGKTNISDRQNWEKTTSVRRQQNLNAKAVCPGGQQECPDDSTCCPTDIPSVIGCCPLPNAVCCSDGQHCCPTSTVCNLGKGTCDGLGFSVKMLKKIKH